MNAKTLLLLFVLTLTLAACAANSGPPPDAVTVQLKWVHQAQFAGFYLAEELGYYAEENLDVTLLEGGPDVDIVETVTHGGADFGVFGSENLIMARGQGQPVVAIAAIYRRSPLVFVSMAGSGIRQPEDFIGHSAALAPEARVQLNAMMHRLGLDASQIEIQPYRYDHAAFLEGNVDITYGYSTGGLIRLRQTGVELNEIWPSDYGVHFYADTLFSTDTYLEQNPDVTTRFLRATLQGWRKAIENTDQAATVTMDYAKEADPDLQALMMEASLPMIHTGVDHIGWMEPEIWEDMHADLVEQDILAKPIDIEQVYTLAYLERVYNE
jgi:NitT/TauT family transport system substrate-binding protein